MQVVILCGGQGTRARDINQDVPKPMIQLGPRPILWHIMKGYAEQGFTDFVLCLGYKSHVIKDYFLNYYLSEADVTVSLGAPNKFEVHNDHAEKDWSITLAETGLHSMTGCRVKRIEKYIRGKQFFLTYGDGVSDIDFHEQVRFHESHGKIGTVTAVQPPGRFGEVAITGDRVTNFSEKPLESPGRISAGFFVMDRRIFKRLTTDPNLIFEREPLTNLAKDSELHAYQHDGFWHPMDNSRDHKFLTGLWETGDAPWKSWDRPKLRVAA